MSPVCPVCSGSGKVKDPKKGMRDCVACKGTGLIKTKHEAVNRKGNEVTPSGEVVQNQGHKNMGPITWEVRRKKRARGLRSETKTENVW